MSQVNGSQVNGVAHSAFIDHVFRYPLISDSVSVVKSNKYGQQGLTLGNRAYATFAKPVLPYFAKPYEYVSPYVKRADDIGDKTLCKIDETFPVVNKPTADVYNDAKGIATLPLRKGLEGKDHFFDVYTGERKDLGGDGLVASGKAFAMAVLIVTSELLAWTRNQISTAKEVTKEKVHEERAN